MSTHTVCTSFFFMEGEPQTATFEDLSIDDSLGALARVRQYGTSAIALQRLVHVKMLTDAAESVPYESIQTDLFPLLRALSMDNEWVIRQHLGEQLGGVAAACLREAEGEDGPGYRGIIESILPLIQTLLNDSQDEVRQSSGASLCHICSLLAPEDRGRRALTLALQLAHDDEQEDLRMTAAKLLNDMVEILGACAWAPVRALPRKLRSLPPPLLPSRFFPSFPLNPLPPSPPDRP